MSNGEKKENLPQKTDPPEIPEQSQDSIENIPPELQEVFKTAPPEIRNEITRMAMMVRSGPVGPPIHPVFDKVTSEHIGKFLKMTKTPSLSPNRIVGSIFSMSV